MHPLTKMLLGAEQKLSQFLGLCKIRAVLA